MGDVAQELRRVLWKTQNSFAHPTCRLPEAAWSEVAVLLVEWAEDLHNDLGLWRTVEEHQQRCFGTPLPLVSIPTEAGLRGFDPRRIQYLLWNLWPCFNRELVMSPTYPDLIRLTETGMVVYGAVSGIGRELRRRSKTCPRTKRLESARICSKPPAALRIATVPPKRTRRGN